MINSDFTDKIRQTERENVIICLSFLSGIFKFSMIGACGALLMCVNIWRNMVHRCLCFNI